MQRARTDEAKDERRRVILTAALNEFYERGFAAARMDDIAARANLSKGTLYLYFESKEALFQALVETVAVPNVERVEMLVASAPSARAAITGLFAFAPIVIRETPLPRFMKILISDAPAFPDILTRYRREVIERALGAIAGLLARADEVGEFRIDNPKLTARLVVAPIIMSALWHILFEHEGDARVDLPSLLALHERMLLTSLETGAGGAP